MGFVPDAHHMMCHRPLSKWWTTEHSYVGLFVVALMSLTVLSDSLASEESRVYSVNDGHRLVPRPERGCVVQLREGTGGAVASTWTPTLGAVKAYRVRGQSRRGVYVVENVGDNVASEQAIVALGRQDSVSYAAPLFSAGESTVAILPEVVVRAAAGTGERRIEQLCDRLGLALKKRMDFTTREYLLEVLGHDAEAVFTAVDRLSQVPFIDWAAPNTAPSLQLCDEVLPSDEYFASQWHLQNTGQSGGTPGADVNALRAWEVTTGDPNIVVAVIDSGVDGNHPDLVDNLVEGYDFYDDDETPDPSPRNVGNAHGTSCAGLVAARGDNNIGVTGVAWNCKIMPIRILSVAEGGSLRSCTEADIATAFRWAAQHGADILSCSWAAGASTIIRSAVKDVTQPGDIGREGNGCIVFVAAGNTGRLIDSLWTKGYPEVITVGATGRDDERWAYSGYGPDLDLMATSGSLGFRSSDTWTTTIGSYRGFGGTSAACPIAAGVAALMLSVNADLSGVDVQRLLFRSARDLGEPGRDDYYGWGRVDAHRAVQMALSPPPPEVILVDNESLHDPGPGDPELSDPKEDGSAEHPFDAIQEALDRVAPGESVVILPGVYAGRGNHDLDFRGKPITVRSIDPTDPLAVGATVIDCQGTSEAMGRGFKFHRGENSSAAVAGLTIMNGYALEGAGVYCTNASNPTIAACVFTNNAATFKIASVVMGFGGAIACDESSPVVQNCVFSDNFAEIEGGAFYSYGGNPTITNCTFVRNIADSGGGVYSDGLISPNVSNCIFWANVPDQIVGEVPVSYSDVQGGWQGSGNFDVDPLFVDSDRGDYHLKSETGRWDLLSQSWVEDDVTSLCIDAGDPNTGWIAEPWPHGQRINVGAYGGTPQASMSLSSVGAVVDLDRDGSAVWHPALDSEARSPEVIW
jgi:subtilisin family serine protease